MRLRESNYSRYYRRLGLFTKLATSYHDARLLREDDPQNASNKNCDKTPCCALHNFRVRLNPWLPMI